MFLVRLAFCRHVICRNYVCSKNFMSNLAGAFPSEPLGKLPRSKTVTCAGNLRISAKR